MTSQSSPWLRRFSKLTCFSTLFLIFAGSLVTSTGSGLAVPDWPLSYGTLFPPMVGGIVYEHGHRMIATLVGLFVLVLSIWLAKVEERRWVKVLGFCALATVIAQGILGGITVLFFLPTPVSVAHGVLAQTFFVLTIIIAYSQSVERRRREEGSEAGSSSALVKAALIFLAAVYIQLILGAVMRHTHSGLAIPDFPAMGGYIFPPFNEEMLLRINRWRFEANLDAVIMPQVIYHFLHRIWALVILIVVILLDVVFRFSKDRQPRIATSLFYVNVVIALQIGLGIATIWSVKDPWITSVHVMVGAATLGLGVLFFLRVAPLSLKKLKTVLVHQN